MIPFTPEEEYESQHQSVLIVSTLISLNDQWLTTQQGVVSALQSIWANDLYKSCEQNVVCDLWHLVAKILLNYFEHNPDDIDLLFQLLRALCLRFIPDFQVIINFNCFIIINKQIYDILPKKDVKDTQKHKKHLCIFSCTVFVL